MIAIAAIAGLFAWYYYGRIAPVITTVTEESVKMKVSEAIDNMTESELTGAEYDDFVITRYNDEGNVSLFI